MHGSPAFVVAEQEDCDYLGIGPINQSNTKKGLNPIGIDYIKQISKTTQLPWFAIGGITNSNLDKVISAGAERIAVVGDGPDKIHDSILFCV